MQTCSPKLARRIVLLPCLLLLATAHLVFAQDTTPINGLPAKIAQLIDPSASPGEVQVETLPGVLGWTDDGGRYQFYQVCDNLSQWGPQIKETGLSVSEIYYHFLKGIQVEVGDPLADVAQKKLAAEAAAVRKKQMEMRKAALKGWDKLQTEERNVPPANRTALSLANSQFGTISRPFRILVSARFSTKRMN